ncbi:MAG: hypothetical protein HUJ26_20205 [Planctomycetaceae bacterium]|nr:hypothetical protein [Planctomycetaceae bacterium]
MNPLLRSSCLCLLFLGLSAHIASAADTPAIRGAVKKALPFVVSEGNSWIETKDCTSCHRTSFQTWALTSAFNAGFDVDQTALEELRVWSRDDLNAINEDDQKAAATRNLECVSHILWAERKLFAPRNDRETRAKFLKYLSENQLDSGLWKANGQLPLQRRSKEETQIVSTMWNALALGTSPDQTSQEARAKAMAQIAQSTTGQSTEELMLRILLAIQENNKEQATRWVSELQSRQRDDGSWNWVGETGSDPLATGMALYALRSARVPVTDPAIQQGVDFLVSHQAENGSWNTTPGTKKKAQGKPVETSIYWGTCWAVIGLTAVLEDDPH